MGFFSPWFLAGAAAVGLPVWLHLLRKHKTTPLPFGSLMFFEKRTQSSIKHRRMRYLVLFALRAALLLLLALAFAHPYIEQKMLPHLRTGEVTVIAIDRSLSMRAGDRLARAKEMAKSLAGGLRAGQRAQVVAFGSRVAVMSEVTDDRPSLVAAIDAVQAGDEGTSFAELSRSLRSIAHSLHLPLHAHVYSDMQKSGMPANFNDLRLNADVRLETHPLEHDATANFTIENVVAPRRVYDAKKARVLVTVAGYNTQKAEKKVSLWLNGRVVETKAATVPESGRASVEFTSLEVPYGRNKGEVRVEAGDALPADDVFYFSVERADPRHALFVHEAADAASLVYFKAALEASGQDAFAIDAATPEQTANLSASKYAFVVLSDVGTLPASFETELRSFVHSGGSVWIALGHNSAGKVPVSGARIVNTIYSGREGTRFEAAGWLDPSHPSIQKNARWDEVKFYQAIQIDPGKARVAAKMTDETPLLVDEQQGDGHILTFASTFDNVANDFPLHPAFVPFIEQTARYLGKLDDAAPAVPVGSYAELRDSKEAGAAVDVVDPKGDRVLSLAEATSAQNIQFTLAGFYDIRRPNGRNELVAVNPDRRESDLAVADPDTLKLWQNTASGNEGSGSTPESASKPLSLWWYAMLAALTLAIAESLLGNQHLSVDSEAP